MFNDFRRRLKAIFDDTEAWYSTDERLQAAISHSLEGNKLYLEGDTPSRPSNRFDRTPIEINRQRSFEAARNALVDEPSARIGVLNFASASSPGGGVKSGAGAQEECLCRCSTLYPALTTDINRKNFYERHRRLDDPIHNDDCIYTPDVLVIKSDVLYPERLAPEDWIKVDVLTCAAPKLRHVSLDDDRLQAIHERRGRHIMTIAAHHEIDVLILGAFGCGAFMNDPNVVSRAYKKILPDFDGAFQKIIFAVFCPPGDDNNFVAFNKILKA